MHPVAQPPATLGDFVTGVGRPTVWQCAHIKSSQNIFKSNLASAKPPSGLQKVLWSQFNTPDC